MMKGYRWAIAAAVLVAVFVDAPMLGIPFVGDDALRANIDGWLAVHHATLFDAFRAELFREDLLNGRFHPLFIALTLVEMHLTHHALPLKAAQLFAVGLNVATIAFLVRQISGSTARAFGAAICSVLVLQMRDVYDATNGDSLHLQLTLECGLLAIGLLAYSFHYRGLIRWLSYGASLLAFAAALLFYEIMLPLILPLLVLISSSGLRWKERSALALPFMAVFAADVGILVAVRRIWPPSAGAVYAANYGSPYIHAVFSQVVSMVPFVYELADPQAIFDVTGMYKRFAVLIAFAAFAAALGWALTKKSTNAEERPTWGIAPAVATGVALLAPAAIVAASPLYQQVIRFGLPYAPVYLQGFGLAVVASVCLPRRTATPWSLCLLGAAFAASTYVLHASNAVVAGELVPSGFARRTIVSGLRHGAARGVPAGALVFLDHSYYWVNDNSYFGRADTARGPLLWDSMYFYRLWSGRTWRTRPLSAERLAAGVTAFEIRSIDNDARSGALIVEKVLGRGGGLVPVIADAVIFERGAAIGSSRTPVLGSAFAARDFTVIDRGENWRLRVFRAHCTSLPNDALVADAASSAQIVYGNGFSVAEDDGRLRWRWAGPQASLVLTNPTAAPLVTELSAPIETAGGARGTVVVWSAGDKQRIAIGDRAKTIRMNVSLPPRSAVEIRFEAHSPNVALPGDPRDLRFRIVEPTLTDRFGCAAEDAAPHSR